MDSVAIVQGPLDVSRDFIDYPFFADLGAIQVAGELRAQGREVALVSALALPSSTLTDLGGGRVRLGAEPSVVAERVPESARTIVLGLTPFHRPPARDAAIVQTIEALRARSPRARIVLADLYQSGQHVVDARSREIAAAYPEIDALLRYEAEASLPALLDELDTRTRGDAVLLRDGDDPSLDALATPAWDLVDLDAYFEFHERVVRALGRPRWAFPIDGKSAPIVTSRGCPYRCVHCSSNPRARHDGELVRPKTQRRSPLAKIDETLSELARRGVRRVHLLDELANVNEAHFEGVLSLIEEHDLALEIPNGLRADHLRRASMQRLRGRLTTLSVSAESGVQRVVTEVVDKDLDLASIERVATDARDLGVPLLVHFMIGLPGETKPEINATLDYAMRLFDQTGAEPSVQFATPLPGTRLAARAGRLPVVDDWGPRFQRAPTIATDAFTLDELARFKWTFDQRIEAMRGPKKIILNATYKCNNRCTFCATGTRTQLDGDLGKQGELLVKYRKLGVRLLDIDGGEPTLNPSLFTLVKLARNLGYERVNVTTNARMAGYADYAERLVNSGVTSVLVSIHGPDATTHAQNVGVAEAFEQTIAGAKNLLRLAPKHVELGANITLTKSNYEKLGEVAELVLGLGLPWLNIQFLTPFGRATGAIAPDTQAAADVTRRVIEQYRDRMKLQVINLPFCFLPGLEEHLLGDLLKLERHMLFVNNEEVNLFEYLRERRVKKPVCEGCPHAIFCGGFFEMGDSPEPTWLVRAEDLVRPLREDVPRAAPTPR